MDLATYNALMDGRVTIDDLRKLPDGLSSTDYLEAKLLEAAAVIVLASRAVGVDHPAWVLLDDYDGSMDAVRELAENQRARSAQQIRDELVCCDIYERLQGLYAADGNPTYAYRELRHSNQYHPICHYGEWAARVVEQDTRADPGRPGEAWALAQRVIELEHQLKQRDAEIRTMEQERRWTER